MSQSDTSRRNEHWLKRLRKYRDITVEELAEHVHISRNTLLRYENGTRRPPPETARLLARKLKVADEDEERFVRLLRGLDPGEYEWLTQGSPSPGRTGPGGGQHRQDDAISDPFKISDDIEQVFTDMVHIRDHFAQLLAAPVLRKRMLVLHGIGGVGKTSLLRMLRLSALRAHVPVSLASGEEINNIPDLLGSWEKDLRSLGVLLSRFDELFRQYRQFELLRAEYELSPGEGSWRGRFDKAEADFVADPSPLLTEAFIGDIALAADERRIVLIVDTFEQMTAFEKWMLIFAERMHPNVLLVLATRKVPAWDSVSPAWRAKAEVQPLVPMTADLVRELVTLYCAMVGVPAPEPDQTSDIVSFSRGLPMVAASAVRIWIDYGMVKFESVRPQVVADLVDQLLESVPADMVSALQAAAAVRWFNIPLLRVLLARDDVEELYRKLKRFPFVRTRSEGFAFHDAVREMIDENLQISDEETHRTFHERAEQYFRMRSKKEFDQEQLYHLVLTREAEGVSRFEQTCEEFVGKHLVEHLRALVNNFSTYAYRIKDKSSSLWLSYYQGHVEQFEGRITQASAIFRRLGSDKAAEPKLRAYALSDYGQILRRRETLRLPGVEAAAVAALKASLSTGFAADQKLALSWLYLGDVYLARADFDEALGYMHRAKIILEDADNKIGLLTVVDWERGIYGRQGHWRKLLDMYDEIRDLYRSMGEPPYLRSHIYPQYEMLFLGRYAQLEADLRPVIDAAEAEHDWEAVSQKVRDLGLALAYQGRRDEALACLERGVELAGRWSDSGAHGEFVAHLFYGSSLLRLGDLERAVGYLHKALELGETIKARLEALPNCLATMYELKKDFAKARSYYSMSLKVSREGGRSYYACAALVGLFRVCRAEGDLDNLTELAASIEALAGRYEYNDLMAALRLEQGHLAVEDYSRRSGRGSVANENEALLFYQEALVYALRYNRFLLDDVLSGRDASPLQPIIRQAGKSPDGAQLLHALKVWWQTSTNSISIEPDKSISLAPQRVYLEEAEQVIRAIEPGDGLPQSTVVRQIDSALRAQTQLYQGRV